MKRNKLIMNVANKLINDTNSQYYNNLKEELKDFAEVDNTYINKPLKKKSTSHFNSGEYCMVDDDDE